MKQELVSPPKSQNSFYKTNIVKFVNHKNRVIDNDEIFVDEFYIFSDPLIQTYQTT